MTGASILPSPETVEAEDRFVFSVLNKGKFRGFGRVWNERVHPKKPKVPSSTVVTVCVATTFIEPYYNGYAAVLVHLPLIDPDALRESIVDASISAVYASD